MTEKQSNDLATVLRFAVHAGAAMLQAGGEIERVEGTIGHIARGFGAIRVDAYATPTGVFVTGDAADGSTHTVVRRIPATTNDLTAVRAINDLSRRTAGGALTLAEAEAELQQIIAAKPPYSSLQTLGAAAVSSAAFAFLFGASGFDTAGATIAGFLVNWAVLRTDVFGWGAFARSWIGGLVAAAVAGLIHAGFPVINVNYTIIGAVMTLVPGLAITNSLRDIMGGQLVSGVARAVEALVTAVGIAAGVGLALGIGRVSL